MSNQNKPVKVIGRFTIGFDDETKASIADLKNKLDAVPLRFGFGNVMPVGGLLAATQDTAANDAPQPALKQMGQWVFEGQDNKWVSAHVDWNGVGYFCSLNKIKLVPKKKHWGTSYGDIGFYTQRIGEGFDATNWENSAIDRETVNDVDYLSEYVPEIQGMDAREIIIDELWPDKPVPQITQADMQLIFIKNLSECLIQRMHSMDRFSEADNAIGGAELMPWDIVFDRGVKAFGVITNTHTNSTVSAVFFPKRECGLGNNNFHVDSLKGKVTQTITEAQLTEFRAALEACYA
ncbi:hypothetical protein ACT3S4_04315 [Psychrobacter sp. AOP30-A2-5]|uniref:hypothetical protein n=1 Tax=Psychrobacter sp. AOP30-A2-5 TaxID=3457697 RepID=UPI004035520F